MTDQEMSPRDAEAHRFAVSCPACGIFIPEATGEDGEGDGEDGREV